MKKLKYHLRFQIVPGINAEKDADILADFCIEHRIEEVVLFFAGEEWNNGLLSKKEEDMWFDTVRSTKKILNDRGISVSLNPWMTVLHTDRGRRFPSDRSFQPMVSPLGEKSRACASFADKNWQRYIYDLYGRFARLRFRVIWVEDDFRYHNHAPLTWGGGFENAMCEKFSRSIGKKVGRKELVRRILQTGKPHPWRSKWLKVWRETQLEVATGIADAVKANSQGTTKIGLMSSYPPVHSVEGRRWPELFRSFTIEGQVAHRPNFAPYSDTMGRNRVTSIMLLDMQKKLRPDFCEVSPEIENFTFTAWNKSDTSTWVDMALALFFGSDALLLDLFPLTGNRVDEEPRIGTMLDKSYGSLSWLSSRFSKSYNLFGVGIPWKENAAEFVRTEKGRSLNELESATINAWNFLLLYGIPACTEMQRVNVLFGNTAWIFDDKEILGMLKGGLLLDGYSAEILSKRGFGRYLGVRYKCTLGREKSKYSLEVVDNKYSGLRSGLSFSVNLMDSLRVFEPFEDTMTWSEIITPERERVGAGVTLYENSLGGRTAVFSVENPSKLALSFHRQVMLQSIIKYLYKGNLPFPLVSGSPHLLPMYFKKKGEEVLVVLNGSPDPAFALLETKRKEVFGDAVLLTPLKEPREVKLLKEKGKVKNHNLWKSAWDIPYMSFLVVNFLKRRI
jgi:hypothetical protein